MKVLEGIRVLDVTNVLTGPFCAYLLAQLGADVVKVEHPEGGDLARLLGADAALNARGMGASFLSQNAGKRSIALDLKHPAGRAAFERLVRTADVLVENFRPGVMDRLNLGFSRLQAIQPRLIYCAISGFGQTGPRAQEPAYDQIIQGLSGAMAVTGDAASAPLRCGFPVADTIGGLTAALAVLAALFQRQRSGVGQMVDVSLLDAMIPALGWVVSNLLIAGQQPVPMGNENFTAAPSGTFETRDGRLNIAANKQEQFETLCALVGRPDLKTDPRFRTREARKQNRAALNAQLNAALRSRPATEWEVELNRAGVPAGQVLSLEAALTQPQVLHRQLLRSIRVPALDREIQIIGLGAKFSAGQTGVDRAPPELGAHADAILGEAGFTPEEIVALRRSGAMGDSLA